MQRFMSRKITDLPYLSACHSEWTDNLNDVQSSDGHKHVPVLEKAGPVVPVVQVSYNAARVHCGCIACQQCESTPQGQ